jgi:hypothetical protein
VVFGRRLVRGPYAIATLTFGAVERDIRLFKQHGECLTAMVAYRDPAMIEKSSEAIRAGRIILGVGANAENAWSCRLAAIEV